MGKSLNELTRKASFFLRDKIKIARLNLTDVTHAQLLAEEVTNGNPWSPDARTMAVISHAAFEVDDFGRIIDVIHNRLMRFDERNWRTSYNTTILLEYLLTHGPKSTIDEFQDDKGVFLDMKQFRFIDDKGFDWGLRVQRLSDRILNLLQDPQFIQDERAKARKITREIKGYGQQNYSYGYGYDREESQRWRRVRYVIHSQDQERMKFLSTEEEVEYSSDHPFIKHQMQGAESLLLKKII